MAQLYPYLNFENTKETLAYYEAVFGAKTLSRLPAGKEMLDAMSITLPVEETTMHAMFEIHGNHFMASDRFGKSAVIGDAISLMIDYNSEDMEDVEKMRTLYNRVVENGESTITMPLAEQFWGGSMAAFTDKYGVSWMLHSQPYSKLG